MAIVQRAAFQGLRGSCCLMALVGGGSLALADPLDSRLVGAWAVSTSECSALFEKGDGGWRYRSPVDKFAQAAIIRPGQILAPAGICRILEVAKTKDGVALKSECNDSVSVQTQTAIIRIQSGDRIVYSPAGDPVLDTTLIKCPP